MGIGDNNDKRSIFISRYEKTFFSFYNYNNLFIILDGNLNNWNITKEQLNFFEQTLKNLLPDTNNIFIFSHQLIWIDDIKFNKASPNSLEGKINKTNYWMTVKPILKKYNKNIILIAGDVGARSNGKELFCLKDDNIVYIASGMGGGTRDNFLIFESKKGKIRINVEKF